MKEKISSLMTEINGDYRRKTTLFSFFSALLNLFFTFFHAVLGVVSSSLWHGSISVYYLVLFVIRTILVVTERRKEEEKVRMGVYTLTHILLLFMNISLIVPIIVMIRGGRTYSYGLIPAIAMAVYTTYRVTVAVMNLMRAKRSGSRTLKTLRTVNFLDALLSVLTLQNAMIAANGGTDDDMHTLMIYTSAAIWLFMVFLSIRSFRKITAE
jgi:hypothetical protein